MDDNWKLFCSENVNEPMVKWKLFSSLKIQEANRNTKSSYQATYIVKVRFWATTLNGDSLILNAHGKQSEASSIFVILKSKVVETKDQTDF